VCPLHDLSYNTDLARIFSFEYHDPVVLDNWEVFLIVHNQRVLQLEAFLFSDSIAVLLRLDRYLRLLHLGPREGTVFLSIWADSAIWSQGTEFPVLFRIGQGPLPDALDFLILPHYALHDGLLGVPTFLLEFLSLLAFPLVPLDCIFDFADFFELFGLSGSVAPWPDYQLAHGGRGGGDGDGCARVCGLPSHRMADDEGRGDGYRRIIQMQCESRELAGRCLLHGDGLVAVVPPEVAINAFDMVSQISAPAPGRCDCLNILPPQNTSPMT
jgi:hypothetical protein